MCNGGFNVILVIGILYLISLSFSYLNSFLYHTMSLFCYVLWRASVDNPFLTVLNTWTSSFVLSMIIHAHVHFEFLKVSIVRLALEPLNLSVLCLVVDQGLVVCFWGKGVAFWPAPTTHQPGLMPIGLVFYPSAISVDRAALFLVDQPLFLAETPFSAFTDIFLPVGASCWSLGVSSIHVYGLIWTKL